MYAKIFSIALMALALVSCKCHHKKCDLARNEGYTECKDRLASDGKLTDAQGRTLVSDRTYFAFDSSELTDASRKTLDDQVVLLQSQPDKRSTITGHCDERGTREYNIGLGERRANANKDYLVAQGVDPSRLDVISKGKDDPIVLGSTEEAWAQNRVAILS